MAAFTLKMMAVTIMLLCLGLRISRIMRSDALIIALALGMAMLASASVLTQDLSSGAWLFAGHVLSVLALQRMYGRLPVHPIRAYRRARRHR